MAWQHSIHFYEQLGRLVTGGLSIEESLGILQGAGGPYRNWAPHLQRACGAGQPLHEGLTSCGERPFIVALIAAGENSSRLPDCCRAIVSFYSQAQEMRRSIIARSLYPLLLIHLAMILPCGVLSILGHAAWWSILIGPLLLWSLALGCWLLMHILGKGETLSALALRWPLQLLSQPFITHIGGQVLHHCLSAGMLASEALRHASSSCGNRIMGHRLHQAAANIEAGSCPDLTQALSQAGWTQEYVDMVAIGERSGDLDGSLQRLVALSGERFRIRLAILTRSLTAAIYITAVIITIIAILFMFQRIYLEPLNRVMNR